MKSKLISRQSILFGTNACQFHHLCVCGGAGWADTQVRTLRKQLRRMEYQVPA